MPTAFFEIDGAVYDREIQAREAKNRVVFIMICDIDRGCCVCVGFGESDNLSDRDDECCSALRVHLYVKRYPRFTV